MNHRYHHFELEHWALQVRAQTRLELGKLRQRHEREQAHATYEPTLLERWMLAVQQFQRDTRGVIGQWLPTIERALMRLINPKAQPEQVLPHTSNEQT